MTALVWRRGKFPRRLAFGRSVEHDPPRLHLLTGDRGD
jgi:hypothetical protein